MLPRQSQDSVRTPMKLAANIRPQIRIHSGSRTLYSIVGFFGIRYPVRGSIPIAMLQRNAFGAPLPYNELLVTDEDETMRGGKSWSSLALEVFSIILGVLLALAVSEWQQAREDEKRAAKALQTVKLELQANRDILRRIHENNQQTIDKARAAGPEESEDLQFIPGVQVRSTAWDTLLATGVSAHVDYALLLALSETYSIQAIYRQTGMQLVDASMTMAAMATVQGTDIDNEVMQDRFMGYFTMLLAMEEALIESYGGSLALFGWLPATSTAPSEDEQGL